MGAYFQSICGCTKGKSELETACCSPDLLIRPLPPVLRQNQSEGNRGCVPGDRLAGTYSRQEDITERYQHKSNGKKTFLMESFLHLVGFDKEAPRWKEKWLHSGASQYFRNTRVYLTWHLVGDTAAIPSRVLSLQRRAKS